jgi:hypothetical protein
MRFLIQEALDLLLEEDRQGALKIRDRSSP